MAATLEFRSEQVSLFFIFKLPRYFLPRFQIICLSGQETKGKIDIKMAAILDFRSVFNLQVPRILPTKFQVSRPFVSGEEAKIDF